MLLNLSLQCLCSRPGTGTLTSLSLYPMLPFNVNLVLIKPLMPTREIRNCNKIASRRLAWVSFDTARMFQRLAPLQFSTSLASVRRAICPARYVGLFPTYVERLSCSLALRPGSMLWAPIWCVWPTAVGYCHHLLVRSAVFPCSSLLAYQTTNETLAIFQASREMI